MHHLHAFGPLSRLAELVLTREANLPTLCVLLCGEVKCSKKPFDVHCRILYAYTIIYVNIGFFTMAGAAVTLSAPE